MVWFSIPYRILFMENIMKIYMLIILLCYTFFSCKTDNDIEPTYNTRIEWTSNLYSNDYESHTVYEDYIYFYERPPGYTTTNTYSLTKLNAKTGEFIWRSMEFSNIVFCQPIVTGDYVFTLLKPNYILSFSKETGEHKATMTFDIQDENLEFECNTALFKNYFYIGLWGKKASYFIRFNMNKINNENGPDLLQSVLPEILWEIKNNSAITARPIVYNNCIYTGTFSPLALEPIEVVGIDTNTGKMVFHIEFGGPEDNNDNILPETGAGIDGNPIFIHEDTLYYLSRSISAWNINTGEKLYRHVFTYDIPYSKWYIASSLQPVYHNGNIYYTGSAADSEKGYRNIHCINAATGKLVWNTIVKDSETLQTNPIIAHNKLYISQNSGFYVYNPKNGKLLGVDRTFCGAGLFGRNILYNDYMICIRKDDTGCGKLVAVYVGK